MRAVILLALLLVLPNLGYSQQNRYVEPIQQALNRQPPLCLGEVEWPVSTEQGGVSWVTGRMGALVDIGFVTQKRRATGQQWLLTPQGKKEFKKNGDFCYGRLRVNNIKEIINNNDGTVAVIFDYRIENLPLWAKSPAIRGAYSELDNLVTGIQNARYQADFLRQANGSLAIIGEPYQLDLFY